MTTDKAAALYEITQGHGHITSVYMHHMYKYNQYKTLLGMQDMPCDNRWLHFRLLNTVAV